MFSRTRFNRGCLLLTLAILAAGLSMSASRSVRAEGASPEATSTPTESLVYSFGVGAGNIVCSHIADGAIPQGSLTYVTATGLLFGMTSSTTGQGNGNGTIFQIAPDGSDYAVDVFFAGPKTDGSNPLYNSMALVGTALYGTTQLGGQHNNGTIFSINDDGTGYSMPLFDFPKTQSHSQGTQPGSQFVLLNTLLYGMTSEGGKHGGQTGDGVIFSFDPSNNNYTRLYSFNGSHGSDPLGQLIADPDGLTLYGMTRSGGKADVGVIFSFDVANNKVKVLHNFRCPGNATPTCVDNTDGATPDHGALTQIGDMLYGLTTNGGKFGSGILFSMKTNGNNFQVLQQFGNPSTNDGINPHGSLMLNGTVLYGTTKLGGKQGNGTVFQYDTSDGLYARVYDFQNGHDAANPVDDVILLDNALYGMTPAGGLCSDGAIYAIQLVP